LISNDANRLRPDDGGKRGCAVRASLWRMPGQD